MKKHQIRIPVLLPEVPDGKDRCVHKLIEGLEGTDGVDKVHVSEGKENPVPCLCFHYDPEKTSIEKIQSYLDFKKNQRDANLDTKQPTTSEQ